MSKDQLLGHWTIVAWEQRYDDGRLLLPLGPAPEGFIRYDSDGRMVCMIASGGRQNLAGAQWTAPDAEKARAYSEFMAYAGTYRVDGQQVTHQVETTLFPNWKGSRQVRIVSLVGDELHIIARLEDGSSEARTALLRWKRSRAQVAQAV